MYERLPELAKSTFPRSTSKKHPFLVETGTSCRSSKNVGRQLRARKSKVNVFKTYRQLKKCGGRGATKAPGTCDRRIAKQLDR